MGTGVHSREKLVYLKPANQNKEPLRLYPEKSAASSRRPHRRTPYTPALTLVTCCHFWLRLLSGLSLCFWTVLCYFAICARLLFFGSSNGMSRTWKCLVHAPITVMKESRKDIPQGLQGKWSNMKSRDQREASRWVQRQEKDRDLTPRS